MKSDVASGTTSSGAGSQSGPKHVAIIMDGNGRWATQRGLPRAAGHERGVEALRRTVEAAPSFGISHLTVFSFSTENWRRPAAEVSALFGLLKAYVQKDLSRLTKEGVRIRVIGSRTGLPADVSAIVEKAERQTNDNEKFFLTIAFNYGGREEIARATQRIARDVAAGKLDADSICEDTLNTYIDTHGLPDPDLMIRTSGELRLSNFLLWQAAYSELIFMDVLWPDFSKVQLEQAVETFNARERRYGAVSTEVSHG